MRSKRQRREWVTATEILHYLIEIATVKLRQKDDETIDESDRTNALLAVQRYLVRKGFKLKRSKSLMNNLNHIALRNEYVRELLANCTKPNGQRLREKYEEEIYMYLHYQNLMTRCSTQNDMFEKPLRMQRKDRRYCFLFAIHWSHVIDGAMHSASFFRNGAWFLSHHTKRGSLGGYHPNFNSKNFVEWLRDMLLPNLTSLSITIIDNASYLKAKPSDTPKD